jgi:hypothetical protein
MRAGIPPARERVQAPGDHRGGEVLRADRDRPARPAVAEVGEERQHDVAQDRVERERREQAVERALGRGFVEPVQGGAQLGREPVEVGRRRRGDGRRGHRGRRRRREARGHGRGVAALHVVEHPADARLVGGGVETLAGA